ncbi:MAG TPA: hypothetical protein VGK84_06450 [Candidatus Tumulicola sp.]|jgi:hypothetical protein
MMAATLVTNLRMRGAVAGSVVLHGLVALVIPALAFTAASGDAIPTISFARIARIQIQPTPHPIPLAQAPHLKIRPNVSLASQAAPALSASRHTVLANATHGQPAAAPRSAPVLRLGEGKAPIAAAPQATASPAVRTVSSTKGRDDGGYMPFGAEEPVPVLDPAVLKQLAALGVHSTLTITVDEDGKTKNVVFDPSIDDATKSKVQALLADASWDPAVCGGGIACEGTATIKL